MPAIMPPRTAAVLTAFAIAAVGSPLVVHHSAAQARPTPIALHASNSHYFEWRGRPTILIPSGEHYGAVMNLDRVLILWRVPDGA